MEDLDNSDRSPRRRHLDLSVAQVAASSMAAVAGAVLASELGVYGTILGAAVVSAGATVGGALFQHVFHRTGEQLRDLTGTLPNGVPVRRPPGRPDPFETDPHDTFDPFDPGGERTRLLAAIAPPEAESVTVYRGRGTRRPRSWKTWALMSVLVFGLAMGTVTTVELLAGKPVTAIVRDEPGKGTSFGGGTAGRSGGSGSGTPATSLPSGGASEPGSRSSGGVSGGPDSTPGSTPGGSGSGSGTGPSHSPGADPSTSPSATPTPGGTPAPGGSQAAQQPSSGAGAAAPSGPAAP